ncbi:MAG: Clp protease ClpP [Clostridiales bacterium]|nr:Clp protease ClpP [Eubacteriales bacterium]MDH7566866.1 Clp protease ClpP [Clostridiales bacterium]
MGKFWNFIKNEQNDEDVELRISGEIVSDDDAWLYEWFGIPAAYPNAFRNELAQYKGKNITVWIDSYGGDVFAAAGIYNALKEHDGKVTTVVDGKAMSAASVIAMAGEEVQMSPVGIMMIHNPWSNAAGEAKDMRHAADMLDEVKETIINAYQLKTGKSRNKISEMMDNETFMSAKTAVKEGFADKIRYTGTQNEPVENNFIFSHMAIQNSIARSMMKFLEIAKSQSVNGTVPNNSNSQPPAPEPPKAVNNITSMKGEGPMFKTIDELRNACPDLVKQIEDAAREEGRKEERTRIQDIEKIAVNMDPALVSKAKFEEPMDAKELAFKALQADVAKGRQYLDNHEKDVKDSKTEDVTPAPGEGDADKAPAGKIKNAANLIASKFTRK